MDFLHALRVGQAHLFQAAFERYPAVEQHGANRSIPTEDTILECIEQIHRASSYNRAARWSMRPKCDAASANRSVPALASSALRRQIYAVVGHPTAKLVSPCGTFPNNTEMSSFGHASTFSKV